MSILLLLVFISLLLAMGAVLLFSHAFRNKDLSRLEQISLQPLEEDDYGGL